MVLARLRLPRRTGALDWIALDPSGDRCSMARVGREPDGRFRVRWVAEESWSDPTATLRSLKSRADARGHPLVLLLERGRYQLLPMDAPAVPPEEWRQAARWQISQMIDYPVEQACLDILTIPAHVTHRGQASLIAVTAPRPPLQALVDAARDAGVELQAIDVTETALRNIGSLFEETERAQAFLHIGDSHSMLVFTTGGELLLSRTIEVALSQLAHANADVRQQAFERASLELQRTFDSFERVSGRVSLSRLLVSPAALVDDFVSYVRDLLYVTVEPLALETAIGFDDVPQLAGDPRLQSRCLAAIGAAMRPGLSS
jgi:MSHA biogenesis protein MshI